MPVPVMLANLLVMGVGLATIVGCPIVWANIAARIKTGQEVVPFEPRRPAPWTLQFGIILLAFLALAVGFGLYAQAIRHNARDDATAEVVEEPAKSDKPSAEQVALGGLGSEILILFVIAVVFLVLHVTSGATLADFGFDFQRGAYDLRLGALAFVAVSVPTYALQAVLHQLAVKLHWEEMEAYHPVTKALAENRSPSLFLAMTLLAVVLAPLAEELLFRVLLQGWIESLMAHRSAKASVATNEELATSNRLDTDLIAPVSADHRPTSPIAGPIESEPPDTFRLEPEAIEPMITRRASWLPILVTAALFALSHWGNGPSAIPLFFFGLALGYVYQQTHRLWPSLVLHMALNGFTMLIVLAIPMAK